MIGPETISLIWQHRFLHLFSFTQAWRDIMYTYVSSGWSLLVAKEPGTGTILPELHILKRGDSVQDTICQFNIHD